MPRPIDWNKVRPYSFEEFWEHIGHSEQFMNYQHVTYRGQIHDFPSEPGHGSTPWLYGEFLKDAGYGLEDRLYRVSAYTSAFEYLGYHGDFFKKKKQILPSDDGNKMKRRISQDLLRSIHFFVTKNSPHGMLNVDDVHPKAVLKLANAFHEALESLEKAKKKRERTAAKLPKILL